MVSGEQLVSPDFDSVWQLDCEDRGKNSLVTEVIIQGILSNFLY